MKMRGIETVVLGVVIGLAVGVSGFTFVYAKGASYLTNDPSACANCHIMREYYDGWIKSSHRSAAVCNDCHTPHGLTAKYWTKVSNGFRHSLAFTVGRFPEPLQIRARNREITERACRQCHQVIVDAIEGAHRTGAQLSCVRCHSDVGHLR
jgi:cytochrome c nitrite reductase small subunit